MIQFTYNVSQRTIVLQSITPEANYFVKSGPIQWLNAENILTELQTNNSQLNNGNYQKINEQYEITSKFNNQTLGSIQWVFDYYQQNNDTSITQVPSLQGVTIANGIFRDFDNVKVVVNYDNTTGDRLITIG